MCYSFWRLCYQLNYELWASYWGLVAMNAYRAYKNESVLVYAEEMYNQGTAYMVTPEDAAAGAFVNKSSIQGTCNGGEWLFFCSLMPNG